MRIGDKIKEIEKYLSELIEIAPENFEDYKHDFKTKAACERYAEKIVEAVVDLTFLIIKDRALRIPEEDKEAFDVLAQENIISPHLSQKLKEAKGMRNIIAHDYGKIDDEVVFQAVTKELVDDVNEMIKGIRKGI